ncbi:arginosuccinate synthase [Leptospira sp. 2 VSF19]|uniref:Arginosuccinate synthase n=1 Tax=Leptospira soteropolitanensis TaxID=2950025 RepID=A0AAW5VPY3_9LEPT|nr:ATP-binding protein [Leptospira soteropolitanensis]MCW7494036.1 arginosuccinate synthase [Leptospira soteropolitanensis]MCW7501698.1 arginosuccinate synthase [Leptospira soteropolitanensis]MCW7523882.1 arginosuccinate synthase [Leptospira soteropolitanensis]MCW7527747.1 arginosuccinate synthase [Leptospira soteropolitanensis]MCW7531668.1 arginosuccinate synthase [Leptospira soteropolitanensis]
MIAEIPTSIAKIFESALTRMGNNLPKYWAEQKTQFLIAYSGGKDSSILVLFFNYLKETYHIQTPSLFYLSHGIRSIETEEKELLGFLRSTGFPYQFVKKKSQNFLLN